MAHAEKRSPGVHAVPRLPVALAAAVLLCALAPGCVGRPSGAAWDTQLTIDEKNSKIMALGREATPAAVAVLAQATRDPSEEVRIEAIRALGKTRRPEALPLLGELLKSDLPLIRQTATWALGELRLNEGVALLEPLLEDPEPTARTQALGALGKIYTPDTLPVLVRVALKDPEADLRDLAVRLLGVLKDKRAIPVLEAALRSETDDIRARSAVTLGKLGDASCITALTSVFDDPSAIVRGAAALAAARLGSSESLPVIHKKALVETDLLARAAMAHAVAMLATGSHGPEKEWAIAELERILLDNTCPDLARAQSAAALGDLNNCASRPVLRRGLNDRKGMVRKAVSKALSEMKC